MTGYWLRPNPEMNCTLRRVGQNEIHDWFGKRRASPQDSLPSRDFSAVVHRVHTKEDFDALVTDLMPPQETRPALAPELVRTFEAPPFLLVTVVRTKADVGAVRRLLSAFAGVPAVVCIARTLWAPSAYWRRSLAPTHVFPYSASDVRMQTPWSKWSSLALTRDVAEVGLRARSLVFVDPGVWEAASRACGGDGAAASASPVLELQSMASQEWRGLKAEAGWDPSTDKWAWFSSAPSDADGFAVVSMSAAVMMRVTLYSPSKPTSVAFFAGHPRRNATVSLDVDASPARPFPPPATHVWLRTSAGTSFRSLMRCTARAP